MRAINLGVYYEPGIGLLYQRRAEDIPCTAKALEARIYSARARLEDSEELENALQVLIQAGRELNLPVWSDSPAGKAGATADNGRPNRHLRLVHG